MTETGPTGHVQEFNVDLELRAARLCVSARDVLIREYVVPLDDEVPYWGFNEQFIMVRVDFAGTRAGHRVTGSRGGAGRRVSDLNRFHLCTFLKLLPSNAPHCRLIMMQSDSDALCICSNDITPNFLSKMTFDTNTWHGGPS